MNGDVSDAAACKHMRGFALVKLPERLVSEDECQAVSMAIDRLLDDGYCDFILDFVDTYTVSSRLIGHLARLMKRARAVAEQLGKQVAAPGVPRGRMFKMFDDLAAAAAEMSKFDGHGWLVFCSVSPVVQEVFMVV